MVIVTENEHGDTGSNLDEVSHCTNTFRKTKNLIILPPAMLGILSSLTLVMQPV